MSSSPPGFDQRGVIFPESGGIGLAALQMGAADATPQVMALLPIPVRALESCIPSRKASRHKRQVLFSRFELPPPLAAAHHTPRAGRHMNLRLEICRSVRAIRPGKRRALPDTPDVKLQDLVESAKAHIRAKGKHPFRVIKQHFGIQKTRLRGHGEEPLQGECSCSTD